MASIPPTDGTVVITGASSGIGRELARRLASQARALVVVARREERLENLAAELAQAHPGLQVRVRPCDLADPDALALLAEELGRRSEPVDVLINNAGFGHRALLHESDEATLREMIGANVTAPTVLTRRVLPGMLERNRGGILNIGSILALMHRRGSVAYVGTKHYLAGFSDSLRAEVAGTGVVVTEVRPGPVATEFGEVAGGPRSLGSPDFLRIDPVQCATEALRGFQHGKPIVYPGRLNHLLALLLRAAPNPLLRWAMSRRT